MIKVPRVLDPRQILIALDNIDQQPPSHTLSRPQALRRIFVTLACVCICLLLIHYLKSFSSLVQLLEWISTTQGQHKHYWLNTLRQTQWLHLLSYTWWTFWQLIGYVAIPSLIILYSFKQRIRDFGWRFNDTRQHWRGYLLLLTPILFFVILVSFREDFVHHYPFYKQSHRSWLDLLSWECLYMVQFISLEFFFRGFMLQALRPAVGANAIWIMCVPYLMIHFPKLWLEATGAILFGLFLGILALRSRSIWGGFFVHAGVAISMDIASLVQQKAMPSTFLP